MGNHRGTGRTGAAVGALVLSAVAAALGVFTAGWDTTGTSLRFGLLLWAVLFPLAALVLLIGAGDPEDAGGADPR